MYDSAFLPLWVPSAADATVGSAAAAVTQTDVATLTWVGIALRASLKCWRCGETEERLTRRGVVEGLYGAVPLFLCPACAAAQERMYFTACGLPSAAEQQAPEQPAPGVADPLSARDGSHPW